LVTLFDERRDHRTARSEESILTNVSVSIMRRSMSAAGSGSPRTPRRHAAFFDGPGEGFERDVSPAEDEGLAAARPRSCSSVGRLKGNTHIPFADLNNVAIAEQLSAFLHRNKLDPRGATKGKTRR
jgi:hypothetical protein